jgi:hypothetical protein
VSECGNLRGNRCPYFRDIIAYSFQATICTSLQKRVDIRRPNTQKALHKRLKYKLSVFVQHVTDASIRSVYGDRIRLRIRIGRSCKDLSKVMFSEQAMKKVKLSMCLTN